MFGRVLNVANELVRRHTLATGVCTAAVKGAAAEATSQMIVGHPFEADRTIAFGLWNGAYCGGFAFWLYNVQFPARWPLVLANGLAHPRARLHTALMVGADNFIFTPFFCLPSYYAFHSLVESAHRGLDAGFVRRGLERYRDEFVPTVQLSLSLWIPIHTLTFSVVPTHLRVHWSACCSFLTLMCFSALQGKLERARPHASHEGTSGE